MLFSAALGFTYLSTIPATAGLVGKMFGPKYLATLFGITLFSHNIGAFLGAYFGGYFFQLTGEYTIVWLIDIALAIFAAIIHLPIKEKSALPMGAWLWLPTSKRVQRIVKSTNTTVFHYKFYK